MKADFVVVGGGITGVCAAYHLAKRGADVLLVERDQLAPDAPISSSGEHAKAFRTAYGKDHVTTRLSVDSLKQWRAFEQESGEELYVPCGMVIFGADKPATLSRWAFPQHASYALDSAAALKAEGLSHDFLSKPELVERFPQIAPNDDYDHAILDKTAGFLHARKAVRALGALAEKAGAKIIGQTLVQEVVRQGDKVERLVTSRGEVTPRKGVIFAAGYMNPVFAPELQPKVQVTQQQIVFLKPSNPAAYAPSVFPIVVNLNQWRYVFPVHGPGVVKVADDDKRPREKLIHPQTPLKSGADDWFRADARKFLRDYVPGLENAAESSSSTCRYTNTVSEKYLVYKKGNVVVISACSGHGFKNGPMTGYLAAGLADEDVSIPVGAKNDFGYEHAHSF